MQPEINPHLLWKTTKPGISKPISVIYTLNKKMCLFLIMYFVYMFVVAHECSTCKFHKGVPDSPEFELQVDVNNPCRGSVSAGGPASTLRQTSKSLWCTFSVWVFVCLRARARMCICICVHTCVPWEYQKTAYLVDSLFFPVDPGDQTQVARFPCRHFALLSHNANPKEFFQPATLQYFW